MPDTQFDPLTSFHDVEALILAHYKSWINSWLAARERRLGIPYQTIARPQSYINKQTFTALPGEERTPMIVAVCNGFSDRPARKGDGTYDAWLRTGIAALVMANETKYVRALAGHYQTALVGIAIRNRSINNGQIVMNDFVDLKLEDVDEEAVGRSMLAVRLDLTYKVFNFAQETPRLDMIPVDPSQPSPDDPAVEKVIVGLEVE